MAIFLLGDVFVCHKSKFNPLLCTLLPLANKTVFYTSEESKKIIHEGLLLIKNGPFFSLRSRAELLTENILFKNTIHIYHE